MMRSQVVDRKLTAFSLAVFLAAIAVTWISTQGTSRRTTLEAHFGIDLLAGIDDTSENRKFEEYRFLGISSQKLHSWVGKLENQTLKLAKALLRQSKLDSTFRKELHHISTYIGESGKLEKLASHAVRKSMPQVSAEVANVSDQDMQRLTALPTQIRASLEPLITEVETHSKLQNQLLTALSLRERALNRSTQTALSLEGKAADGLAAATEHDLRAILAGGGSVFQDLVRAGTRQAAANISAARAVVRRELLDAWRRFDAKDIPALHKSLSAVEMRLDTARNAAERPAEETAAQVNASSCSSSPHLATRAWRLQRPAAFLAYAACGVAGPRSARFGAALWRTAFVRTRSRSKDRTGIKHVRFHTCACRRARTPSARAHGAESCGLRRRRQVAKEGRSELSRLGTDLAEAMALNASATRLLSSEAARRAALARSLTGQVRSGARPRCRVCNVRACGRACVGARARVHVSVCALKWPRVAGVGIVSRPDTPATGTRARRSQ